MINGKNCTEGMFPFMAALTWMASGTKSECSGFIVSPSAILAAAHCLHLKDMNVLSANYTARVGSIDKSKTQLVELTAHLNPNYDKTNHNYDVAILKPTKGTLPMGKRVKAIILEEEYIKPNRALSMGWGKTSTKDCVASSGTVSQVLLYHPQTVERVGTNKIHVKGTESKTCMGDSGSPLVEKRKGTLVAIGILSAGTAVGKEVYTRISAQKDFIKQHAPDAKWQ